jgi:tRNA-specific 2-thiouridylase
MKSTSDNSNISIGVAMSGGVDSSVTALLLHEQGYNIVGLTMKLWQSAEGGDHERPCCSVSMSRDAAEVCAALGVPHYTLNLTKEFKQSVIDDFQSEYLAGRTPNPCVSCNTVLKWGELWNKVKSLGLDYLATGHYAQIIADDDGGHHLLRGLDSNKDQTYFLWGIRRELLSKTMFPLGSLAKSEVRRIAAKHGLAVADKPESQDICFIPDNNYQKWLTDRTPELAGNAFTGEMIDPQGKVLSHHKGYPFFTVGQRKGLGLGGGKKYYVTQIDPESKAVHLGDREDLNSDSFEVESLNWLQDPEKYSHGSIEVKIRYRDPGVPARVVSGINGSVKLRTEVPVQAVAPGQSAVFYSGDEVIGGGIIK